MPEEANDGSGTKTSTKKLPDVPEENSLLHIVLEYRKQQLRLDKLGRGAGAPWPWPMLSRCVCALYSSLVFNAHYIFAGPPLRAA